MELNGSHVVQMSGQSEHALLGLVAPDFHFVVIASTYEHRLSHVEVDSSHRSIMLLELLNEGLCSVVEQIDRAIVQ